MASCNDPSNIYNPDVHIVENIGISDIVETIFLKPCDLSKIYRVIPNEVDNELQFQILLEIIIQGMYILADNNLILNTLDNYNNSILEKTSKYVAMLGYRMNIDKIDIDHLNFFECSKWEDYYCLLSDTRRNKNNTTWKIKDYSIAQNVNFAYNVNQTPLEYYRAFFTTFDDDNNIKNGYYIHFEKIQVFVNNVKLQF
jgi:hypothetical protein